jgi:hypothetical protein
MATETMERCSSRIKAEDQADESISEPPELRDKFSSLLRPCSVSTLGFLDLKGKVLSDV